MFKFFKRRKPTQIVSSPVSDVSECLKSIKGFTELLNTTRIPAQFFTTYQRALELCTLASFMQMDSEQADELISLTDFLRNNKTDLTYGLIDRLSQTGDLVFVKDEFILYRTHMSTHCYNYFLQASGILYDQYIYCTVSFGDERVYYYVCEFEDIAPGDTVVVPVGDRMEEKIATVVDVTVYRYDEVPYPLKLTKIIISKIG